ncbi:MAG: type II toxin-antitoxin system VapC family toxin [Caldilineaceae bacterium]|nr:type II toxin-antitoxin system VapC family toxin [Caldilineaceae bacterium]
MILLDSDVLIDLFRRYPAAIAWFDLLHEDEELMVPGYVVMELIQGCRNKPEQDKVQREFATYRVAWLSSADCDRALEVFATYRLSHSAGLLDVLIGQIAVALGVPLYTFNQRHYGFIPGLQTIQPYTKSG